MTRLLLSFSFLLIFQMGAFAQTGINWFEGNVREALDHSASKREMTLIFVQADWCQKCQLMEAVWEDPTLFPIVNESFTCVRMDIASAEDAFSRRLLRISHHPSVVLVSPDRYPVYKINGFYAAASMMDSLRSAMDPQQQALPFHGKIIPMSSVDSAFYATGDCQLFTVPLPESASAWPEFILNPHHFNRIFHCQKELNHSLMAFFVQEKQALQKLYGKDVGEWVRELFVGRARIEGRAQNRTFLDELAFAEANYLQNEPAIAAEARLHFADEGFYSQDFVDAVAHYMTLEPVLSAIEYNSLAFKLAFSHGKKRDMPLANQLVDESLELVTGYANMDTKALILYRMGDKKAGDAWGQKAILYAQENGIDFSPTVEIFRMHSKKMWKKYRDSVPE